MKRAIEIILTILVVGVFAFLATFGTFFYFKEKDCAVSLYTSACYRTYPQFLELLVGVK